MRTFFSNIFITIISLSFSSSTDLIKNINKLACKNCIHYIPPPYTKYESSNSRCSKFGSKDIVTDEITYDYASSCRNNESKCGEDGLYYEKDSDIEFKKFKHELLVDKTIFIACVSSFLFIVILAVIQTL